LTNLGISFVRQYPIRNPKTGRYIAVADFLINDKIVLEVNGTFWHTDPRFFPDGPVFEAQRKTARQYAHKVAALQTLGVPLIEVWEADLNESIIDTLRNALSGYAL